MPLSDVAIRNAKCVEKPRKISDGGGLFLLVQTSGGKLWRLAYRFQGKQKTLALGAYPAVGLKDARIAKDNAKTLLARGIDPGEQKKKDRRQARIEAGNSFELVAGEWFEARRDGWTSGYADRIWRRIQADIFPKIGGRPIHLIEPPELLDAIRLVEKRGAVVLAKRLLQICGQVFRYAVADGRTVRDPSQDLRGALRTRSAQKHRSALKADELSEFLGKVQVYDGDRSTKLALLLTVHTFLRTSEIRFGKWSEIERLDGENPLWRIPAGRMKARSEHLVPLSVQAVQILQDLKLTAGRSEMMLPAPTKSGVISENTLLYALYRMGYHSRATVHGFRSTASTILNESGFNRDWIERQLAHTERNGVRAAYNAAEWLKDRRTMLQWWSDYLDEALSHPS